MLARACPGHAAHPSAAFGRRCPEGVQLSILAYYMPALVLLPPGIEQHTGAGTASARMPEGGGTTRDGRSGHGMNSWALQNLCWRALSASAQHRQPCNTGNTTIRSATELDTGGTRSCYGCYSCTEANLLDLRGSGAAMRGLEMGLTRAPAPPLACRNTAGMEMEGTGGDPMEPTVLRIVPDSSLGEDALMAKSVHLFVTS